MKSQLLRNEMWFLLVEKVSYKEIMERLHLSHGAFFRHLAAIKVQNRKWIEELAKDEFVFEYLGLGLPDGTVRGEAVDNWPRHMGTLTPKQN